MGRGIAEVHQQPIAQILGNVPLIALDDLGAGLMVGAYDFPQVFGVELRGERGRADQVTEHHGQLPPFGGSPSRVTQSRV